MSKDAASLVAQIFAALLIAQLVEDRSLSRTPDGKQRQDGATFLNTIFLFGLISSGIGLLISLLAVLRLARPGTVIAVFCAVFLVFSLFAMVVPAAGRLPHLSLSRDHPWVNEAVQSIVIMVLVLAVAVAVYKFAAAHQPVIDIHESP